MFKDTRDLVNHIEDLLNLPESSILDVVGLYRHIPHEESIETMTEYLETRGDKTVSSKSLYDLASVVLNLVGKFTTRN